MATMKMEFHSGKMEHCFKGTVTNTTGMCSMGEALVVKEGHMPL